jgi:hypothetical protein
VRWRLSRQLFIKFDIFRSFLRFCSLAAVLERVHFNGERHSGVRNKMGGGDIRGQAVGLGNAMGQGGLTGDGGRSGLCHWAGRGLEFSVFLGRGRGWLGVDGCGLLLAKPFGFIDFRGDRGRSGFVLLRDGATVGDEVLHGNDHGEGLDLAGNAVSGHFGAKVGEFPEAVEYFFTVEVQPVLFPGLLVDKLLMDGGAVLEHVVADAGFGFDVGCGVGVEADGFGGLTVGHGAREDQEGKGHFLIGDGIADFIFRHSWLLDCGNLR